MKTATILTFLAASAASVLAQNHTTGTGGHTSTHGGGHGTGISSSTSVPHGNSTSGIHTGTATGTHTGTLITPTKTFVPTETTGHGTSIPTAGARANTAAGALAAVGLAACLL